MTTDTQQHVVTDLHSLLVEPTPRAARAVALMLLDVLDAEHTRLASPKDAEALHDFRVAMRRLRSWLRAYRKNVRDSVGKKSMMKLSELNAVTTDSRDIEVHLAWLATQQRTLKASDKADVKWLVDRLKADKARADAALHEGVGSEFTELSARLRKNLLRYAVAVWDQEEHERWAVTAAAQIQDAFLILRRRLAAIEDAKDDEHTHRARIAGKRLRYLLEPLTGTVNGVPETVELLKAAQDLLGSMHDSYVFTRFVRRHAQRPVTRVNPSDSRPGTAAGFQTLARRLGARRKKAWKTFTNEWLERDFATLSTHVHAIVRELREIGGEGIEIERKYMLKVLPPETRQAPVAEIEQGYLPGKTLIERLRKEKTPEGVRHVRTIKTGSGVVRTEIEEETSASVFKAMWPLTKGKRLRKRRYRLADAGHVWEIDEFLDRKLVLAEIELSSEHDQVVIPEWLARCIVREVTAEPDYLNYTLAR